MNVYSRRSPVFFLEKSHTFDKQNKNIARAFYED